MRFGAIRQGGLIPVTVQANKFRQQRFSMFLALLDKIIARKGSAHVLDLGGTSDYWNRLAPLWMSKPVRFTIVNVGLSPMEDERMTLLSGDARSLPDFDDHSFDMVHSNSVIEHVGHWHEMTSMAQEIRRLAPAYFVQTPNMWFPLEVHFKLPFLHWLPEQTRASILLAPKGKFLPVDAGLPEAMDLVQRVNLLSHGQMTTLFPDARIARERFMLLTKSLIAIRESEA